MIIFNYKKKVIETQCSHHLGDNIINFIFFYKIKKYIERNRIIIHYYCLQQYHKNLLEFKCSDNIKLLNYENKGHVLWQGNVPNYYFIEDTLCVMFNLFLNKYKFPLSVNAFEYEDMDLFRRFSKLEEKYKQVNVLVINSAPLSGQYHYDKNSWDEFIVKLSKKYTVATSAKVNDILSLNEFSVKNIAALALNVKIIIAINTGPSVPLYNKHILNNIDAFYIFGQGYNFKTRKTKSMLDINELSFLL
jgi:hypothetical protein